MADAIRRRLTTIVLLAGGAALSACASGTIDAALVDPAKYDFYNCEQLAARVPPLEKRAGELQALLVRADGGAGSVIGNVTYGPELHSLRGELALIEQVSDRKNCNPPVRANLPPARR